MYRNLIIFAVGLLFYSTAWATLIGASSAPKHTQVSIEEGRTIQVRWLISTDPAHTNGAFSAQGVLKDTATDTVLKTLTTPFNATEGAGPLRFEEALTITAEETQQWYELGYRRLEYKRQFSTGAERPSTSHARLTIQLTKKGVDPSTGAINSHLAIHHMELAYKPQRFRTEVAQGLPLQAQLTLFFSGVGTLKGSWQLATADSESGQLKYSVMADISKPLQKGSTDWLLSPQLPTQNTGRYAVRFCAHDPAFGNTTPATDSQCPNPLLSSQLNYQVYSVEDDANSGELPEIGQLTANTPLSWNPVESTVVYEMLLSQPASKESVTSATLVGRMLIPGSRSSVTLTPTLVDQLHPGTTYSWKINALDIHGDLIQQSPVASFIFIP
jgi:hypothetical protein